MCGITGVLERVPWRDAEQARAMVGRMADALAHRGPDDEGAWLDPAVGVALGHRRLSVIDVSAAGHQPMTSASGRYVLVFNGEVYNFRELRAALERDGVTFQGHCDAEVLLAHIERHGVRDALVHANGMFALAVWDRDGRRLHLARDRMGEKPLYYGWSGRRVVFASELAALARHPDLDLRVDRRAVALFLRFGYVPEPWSIYHDVRKLPPGTSLTVDAAAFDRPEPAPVAYWSASDAVRAGVAGRFLGTDAEAVDALDTLLRDAVAMRMESDVPLGAFLSGGVDSSTVVALMQAQSSTPVRTFTIGSFDVGYDEAQQAKAVAAHLGTDHTELHVTAEQARDVVPLLPTIYDEPFADPSQIPTYLVAQLARRDVTVALSGDGGDELFGGYNRYVFGRALWRRAGRVPVGVRRALRTALATVPASAWDAGARGVSALTRTDVPRLPADKVQKLVEVLDAPDADALYVRLASQWQDPDAVVIGAGEPPSTATSAASWPPLADHVERMMYADLVTYLPGDILTKVDRASMAVSLEARVPLLDHRVVEHAWRLPPSMRIRDGKGKWALRQVLHRYVPEELVDRPKMGFDLPVDAWLRGPLRDWAETLLSERRVRDEGWFEPGPIRHAWREHLAGTHNRAYRLWPVLMFQAWLDRPAGG